MARFGGDEFVVLLRALADANEALVVAGRMLFINSGYGGLVGRPGNVLLAFAPQ